MKTRKLVSYAVTFALSALLLTGCGDKKADSDYVFKIGTANGSLCLAPLHIAVDNGYFEEEFKEAGIKYELVEIDIQQTADMIASKKIDACVGLVGSFIPQVDSGLDIAFTTGLHTGCTKFYTSSDSDINDMSDLKGKKIGVPGMSDSSVVALKRILNDLDIGVSQDNMEIELVVYNLTDLPLALANGAVDAVALHDPVAASAETEYGFRKLFDTTTDGKFSTEYCCAVFVTNESADEHPEAAAAYTRALMKASAYVQAEPENAAKLQIDNNQCSGEIETNAALLSSYNYQPSVSVMEDTFRNACTDLLDIGDLKEGRDIEQFTAEHIAQFDDVPDSYTYNADGTFLEIGSKKK
ncbi:MAG: ABC transporter substrate-binding protein [Lachnospiraceae bacterium]|nr:ABC transporter substrate-binding protein [Lachnospiraceae bacterium]MCM1231321.1 ABC transporter substrate-binding protein [Ruminococcus flavefaciens]